MLQDKLNQEKVELWLYTDMSLSKLRERTRTRLIIVLNLPPDSISTLRDAFTMIRLTTNGKTTSHLADLLPLLHRVGLSYFPQKSTTAV